MKKIFALTGMVFLLVIINLGNAFALGECGYSCCLAGATGTGVTLADNIGLSLQYEYMSMNTIKNGSSTVTPNDTISQHGGYYSVPTSMSMQKLTLVAAMPATDRLSLLLFIPYVINNMDMKSKVSAMGMPMSTVSSLGDMMVMGLYNIYADAPVRPEQRLTAGVGLKLPTGQNDIRGSSGMYIHPDMQPGTGSWDPVITVNYMRAFYPLVLQLNLFYQITTVSNTGYLFGNQFTYDVIANYQVHDFVNVGVQLNGVHTGKDTDYNGMYQMMRVMPSDTNNTGLDSLSITPNVLVKFGSLNGSAQVKVQVPFYQSVTGYQSVMDWRITVSTTWGI